MFDDVIDDIIIFLNKFFFIYLPQTLYDMKVAIIYNDPHPEVHPRITSDVELSFEPYFDITINEPHEGYKAIADALKLVGYDAYILNLKDSYQCFLDDYNTNKPDVVFNLVEIFHDHSHLEMSFASLLELMQIPYTGASPIALGTCQKKILTKGILQSMGVNTPRYCIIAEPSDIKKINLNFPVIIKPASEDASVGIENESVVYDYDKMKARIEYVLKHYKQNVLVEEFINGRELNVAVMGDRIIKVLPISEIDFSAMPSHLHNIVSYQAKWDPLHEAYHKTIPICPAELLPRIERQAKRIALKAFRALGCRDYARVDMRLSENNELFVLEVNPNPDLTEDAGFMRSASASGIPFELALKKIVDLTWTRRARATRRRLAAMMTEYS